MNDPLLRGDLAPTPRTLVDIFRATAAQTPDEPVVDAGNRVMTYAELEHRSAAAFVDAESRMFRQSPPIGVGDRVMAGLSVAFDASVRIGLPLDGWDLAVVDPATGPPSSGLPPASRTRDRERLDAGTGRPPLDVDTDAAGSHATATSPPAYEMLALSRLPTSRGCRWLVEPQCGHSRDTRTVPVTLQRIASARSSSVTPDARRRAGGATGVLGCTAPHHPR